MNHGRLPPRRLRAALLAAVLALLTRTARTTPATPPTPAPPSPVRLSCEQPDHPSGIYYVKADASLTVWVDNRTAEPAELSGDILLGTHTDADFKTISVTPIAPAVVAPGSRAKIPLQVTFAAAGTYELRWKHDNILTPIPTGTPDAPARSLECIFAPRTATAAATNPAPATGIAEDPPWITTLPPAAAYRPGLLSDYIAQTTVRRFIIDERFAFDPAKNVGLGFGASTGASAKEFDALLDEAAKSHAKLFLRVIVPTAVTTGAPGSPPPRPVAPSPDPKSLTAFREYLADAIHRAKGSLSAIAIVPADASVPPTDAAKKIYSTYYLAGYESAKRADKSIALLGTGSARLTALWFLAQDSKLASYIDALAIADAAADPLTARQIIPNKKTPLFLLPPIADTPWPPAAAGLAAGASIVPAPPPGFDHGVTAHLLGGTVFLERLHITVPTADPQLPDTSQIPFIAVFQGDGYALAAIAGFSAGTDLDGDFPLLARTRTQVDPAQPDPPDVPASPTYPNLEIGDDTHSMRVVDNAGAPVDCRTGDNLYVPAADAVVYVLQGGTADELAGSLRVARANRLPAFDLALTAAPEGLTLRLHNITGKPLAGTARLIVPPATPDQTATVLAEKEFTNLLPDKSATLPLPVAPDALAKITTPLVVELTTSGSKSLIQRTAINKP